MTRRMVYVKRGQGQATVYFAGRSWVFGAGYVVSWESDRARGVKMTPAAGASIARRYQGARIEVADMYRDNPWQDDGGES